MWKPIMEVLSKQLSRREQEVFKLMTEGRSACQISRQLSISLCTTKAHMRRIFRKLRADSRFTIGMQHRADTDNNSPLRVKFALTDHEMRIVSLVGKGLGNKEVARELNHSYNTTRAHLRKIFRKLSVTSRLEAVNVVRSLGA